MRVMLIAATSLLLLTGCGQKGPLFLPQDTNLDKPAPSQRDKPAEQPANP
jgi:predicted small lipoprotein YifL